MDEAAKEITARAACAAAAQNHWRLCYHTTEDELISESWQQFCRAQPETAQLRDIQQYFETVFFAQLHVLRSRQPG